jgi:hypothetical protein
MKNIFSRRLFPFITVAVLAVLTFFPPAWAADSPPASGAGALPLPGTNGPSPTALAEIQDLIAHVTDSTNVWYEVHGLYAPALHGKYGGGLGAFYQLNSLFYTGLRLDYVDGGFWMPNGSFGLQVPIKLANWLTFTPLTYAGVGIPISGATIAGVQLGHTPQNNNGEVTGIVGAGGAIRIYNGAKWKFDLVGDAERWSGFPGAQYRGGVAFSKVF